MNARLLIFLFCGSVPIFAHARTWKNFGLSVAMADKEETGVRACRTCRVMPKEL
jgi:hypothetical protein